MSEIGYRFPDAVQAEWDGYKAMLKRLAQQRVISVDQVRSLSQKWLREHVLPSRKEVDGDYMIGVKCDCGIVHIMPSSVRFFQCKCSPNVDRFTVKGRVPLT